MTDKNTLVLQNCTDAPKVERGLSSETSVWPSDDTIEVINIRTDREEIHLKEEVDPIAISISSIKDEPEVSPQTFHWYLGLPFVIMPFVCLPFHINWLPMVNGKGAVHIYRVLNTRIE